MTCFDRVYWGSILHNADVSLACIDDPLDVAVLGLAFSYLLDSQPWAFIVVPLPLYFTFFGALLGYSGVPLFAHFCHTEPIT